MQRRRRIGRGGAVALLALGLLGGALSRYYLGAPPPRAAEAVEVPSPQATWPWPAATRDHPHLGVTRWTDHSATDDTTLDLFEFDFTANPGLRLELYDQDEDDATPGDNSVDYWSRAVGQVTHDLNRMGRGPVVAAWNGLFFAVDKKQWGPGGTAHHVAPIVLNGEVRYNVGNHRWTFGVQYAQGKRTFKTLHLPDRSTLAREFTYAAAGAQCLVREGRGLKLRPFPRIDESAPRGAQPSTPEEAGYIPIVEHIRTSRTSMGWSEDSRKLYLLLVHEPDNETASTIGLKRNLPTAGGWTVADLQRFWLAKQVWGAVNIDGGNVTQACWRRRDGKYGMITPTSLSVNRRQVMGPDFAGAPEGGTLMYFYVRDTGTRALR